MLNRISVLNGVNSGFSVCVDFIFSVSNSVTVGLIFTYHLWKIVDNYI